MFKKEDKVFKIPSGRFDEVSDPRYLQNAKLNYEKIIKYVGKEHIARTEFRNGIIEQEFVDGQGLKTMTIKEIHTETGARLHVLFADLLRMLREEEWIPDLVKNREFSLPDGVANNIFVNRDGVPKLIDFTTYYDVLRLSHDRLFGPPHFELRRADRWLRSAIRAFQSK